ncbi:MAG: SBBP repeat-containing protein, partial [Deltaproteobacteria bacterium]|nr:SBBP repeat-containing protein [Deltaproteobacteria bacterium]
MMSRFHRKHVAGFCTLAFAAALSLILLSGNDEKPARHPVIPEQAAVARILSGMRIPFQENAGQFSPEIAYGARMFSGAAFVTREGEIIYSLYERAGGGSACKVRVFREILIGGRTLEISAEAPSPASVSRFAGNDPSRWIRSIRAWETVRFDRVYDGIDVKLKAHGGSVEKFFHVRPGGDPSAIRLRIEGADRLAINKRGELEAVVGKETVLFSAPVAWQDDGERRIPVAADYEVDGNEYGFRLAAYDPNREIVIDPLLAATYLGGSGPAGTGQGVPDGLDDQPYAIDFDSSGNIYVAGATASSNFPAGYGYDNTFDAASPALTDAFVVKLSGDLTQILAATFLGGSSDDMATSVR